MSTSKVERRQLSTGEVLVIAATFASFIVVGRQAAPRLAAEGEALWTSAKALVAEGSAQELSVQQIANVADSLKHVALLTGSNNWPP
jgi:type III secretion system FlhB-like substrate exporter